VTHGSWVTWVMGQELNGSLGSRVILSDPFPALRGRAPSLILRVEFEHFETDRKWVALPVIANFVALEYQIIFVKTRSESV